MANILSLKDFDNVFHTSMGTNKERAMLVYVNTHTILMFIEYGDGL